MESRSKLSEQATLERPTVSGTAPRILASQLEPELELHEVWEGLLRRRLLISAFVLLGLVAGLVYALITPRQFSATAMVEFAQASTHALGLESAPDGTGDLSTIELLNTELKTQEAEINDDNTAMAVIDQLHLTGSAPYALPAGLAGNDPLLREQGLPLERAPYQRERVIKIFHDHLSVDVVKGTRLLSVTYTDSDPLRAAEVANGVVKASMEQTKARRSTAVAQVSSWLSDQLEVLKGRVVESQRAVEAYERENEKDLAGIAVSSPNSSGRSADTSSTVASVPVTRLLTLNNDLTNAQVARMAKEAIYRVAVSGDPEAVLSLGSSSLVTGIADSSFSSANGGLALLHRLREQQVQLDLQISNASTKYGAKSQGMLELAHQREALALQIRTELDHIRDRARSDMDLATQAENGLRAQVSAQEGEVSRWTTKADHLLLLQSEAASNRALYQDLYAKLQESQLATGIGASRVAFIDPARVPTRPSSPKKRGDVMLGSVVGFALGLLAALGIELFDSSMHTEEAARKALGTSIVGVIPKFPKRSPSSPWIQREPFSRFAEAYRGFRANALTDGHLTPAKVLLFASPWPAEGKATTCLNTAAVLAAQGRRVVIVNADLRRSQGPTAWQESGKAGLSSLLKDGFGHKDALLTLPDVPGVPVLPVGSACANAPDLLGSPQFAELIRELREDFDFVLIDSPPALLYSDAQVLAAHADGCIVIVRAGVTPRRDARRVLETLAGTSAPVLGVLFNAAQTKTSGFSRFGYEI